MATSACILFIFLGIFVFVAPIILYSFVLVHPKYDKKTPDFYVNEKILNPTPCIDSCEVSNDRLRIGLNSPAEFKVILFKQNGKPFKVVNVTCNEPSKPCWIKLPKCTSGVSFELRKPNHAISFDMEIWKIFVLPLAFGVCAAFGLFLLGFGICGIAYRYNQTPYFLYPAPLAYVLVAIAGVVAYLVGVICLGINYLHLDLRRKK